MSAEIEIFDCEQGSEEWHALHIGVPTASHFSDVMAGGAGKVRSRYMSVLTAELMSGISREDEQFRNAAMDRGVEVEDGLRMQFERQTGITTARVGFVRREFEWGYAGCSPDGLIGNDGLLEIKSMRRDLFVDLLKDNKTPREHLDQCQGSLLVTGRAYCWLVIGARGMPRQFRRKLRRDEAHIARLMLGLETFSRELLAQVEALSPEVVEAAERAIEGAA